MDSLRLKSSKKEGLNYINSELSEVRKYHINLYSLDTLQKLADDLTESQLISVRLIKSECRKLDPYKILLYENAMKDAKSKAEVIAKSTEQRIETALMVKENKFIRRQDSKGWMRESNNGMEIESYRLYLELQVVYKVQ